LRVAVEVRQAAGVKVSAGPSGFLGVADGHDVRLTERDGKIVWFELLAGPTS
jgi:hypothetical protein